MSTFFGVPIWLPEMVMPPAQPGVDGDGVRPLRGVVDESSGPCEPCVGAIGRGRDRSMPVPADSSCLCMAI